MLSLPLIDQPIQTERVIGDMGQESGPIVVFIGAIHGNEPSGVLALQEVFEKLNEQSADLQGRLIGLVGNLAALKEKLRFVNQDLNRIWNQDFSRWYRELHTTPDTIGETNVERDQQRELFEFIQPLLDQAESRIANKDYSRPLYFVDLHTTSAPSPPFIAINDQLKNRKYATQFPVATVLGIEEYLEGPLLSYLNDFGHVAMAFEAGQNDDPESVMIHQSFIYMALMAAGILTAEQVPNLKEHIGRLQLCGEATKGMFEVVFRKAISNADNFKMLPGYSNFSPIHKGEVLAGDQAGAIEAHIAGQIFMPLYQASGNDGYFIVRKIPKWALFISRFLRRFNFDRLLLLLPGVSKSKDQPETLIVNKKIARFLATEIFHLLGYRRKQDNGDTMIVSRREITVPE